MAVERLREERHGEHERVERRRLSPAPRRRLVALGRRGLILLEPDLDIVDPHLDRLVERAEPLERVVRRAKWQRCRPQSDGGAEPCKVEDRRGRERGARRLAVAEAGRDRRDKVEVVADAPQDVLAVERRYEGLLEGAREGAVAETRCCREALCQRSSSQETLREDEDEEDVLP